MESISLKAWQRRTIPSVMPQILLPLPQKSASPGQWNKSNNLTKTQAQGSLAATQSRRQAKSCTLPDDDRYSGCPGSSKASTDEPSRMEVLKTRDDYDQHLITSINNVQSENVEGWSSALEQGLVDEATVENDVCGS